MATILAAVDFTGIAKWVGVAGVAIIGIAMAFKGAIPASVMPKRPDYGRGAAGVFLGDNRADRRIGGARYMHHHREGSLMNIKSLFSWCGFFLLAAFLTVRPVHAAIETVPPLVVENWHSVYAVSDFYETTPGAACHAIYLHRLSVYPNNPYIENPIEWNPSYNAYSCKFTYATWPWVIDGFYAEKFGNNGTCPAATPAYTYNRLTALCERTAAVCPAHASGTPCACDAGYKFDAAGTSCVSTCPVSDLPDVTDPEILPFENNPDLSDTARLTPRMQTTLSCLQTAAAAGSPSVGSAYRPPAYNQHLIDVWKKWKELTKGKDSADPACADRKAKIQGHFQRHKLLESQPPVPGSLHTLGEAVDVTINLPAANIDALSTGCQLRRPLPVKDHVHFIHQ